MLPLKLSQKVTNDGIFISIDKVKDFKDKVVEIIIFPTKEKPLLNNENRDFMKFAGRLSENDANEILAYIEDCKKIDEKLWQ